MREYMADCPNRINDIHYMHETNPEVAKDLPIKTDQSLRKVVHEKIRQLYGHGRWILVAHTDEFLYHDPRKVAALAQAADTDHVFWYALHVLPHPSERGRYETNRSPLVQQRFQYFHHDFQQRGHPWMEGRMFHDNPRVRYQNEHGPTLPKHGLERAYNGLGDDWLATMQTRAEVAVRSGRQPIPVESPVYLHYKIVDPAPDNYVARTYPSRSGGTVGLVWVGDECEAGVWR